MMELGKKVNVAIILTTLVLVVGFVVLYSKETHRFLQLTAEASTHGDKFVKGNICVQTDINASQVNERKQLFVSCSGFLE